MLVAVVVVGTLMVDAVVVVHVAVIRTLVVEIVVDVVG